MIPNFRFNFFICFIIIALKEIATLHPELKMEVIIYGTPAEEGGGGKILMIEKGVFDELEICMMSHPTHLEYPAPIWLSCKQLRAVFKGFFCMSIFLAKFNSIGFFL